MQYNCLGKKWNIISFIWLQRPVWSLSTVKFCKSLLEDPILSAKKFIRMKLFLLFLKYRIVYFRFSRLCYWLNCHVEYDKQHHRTFLVRLLLNIPSVNTFPNYQKLVIKGQDKSALIYGSTKTNSGYMLSILYKNFSCFHL